MSRAASESERLSPRMKQWKRARAKLLKPCRYDARKIADLALVCLIVLLIACLYFACIALACIHR